MKRKNRQAIIGYWHTTHKLFLQRLKEINAIRSVDNQMTFIEFMHEVAKAALK